MFKRRQRRNRRLARSRSSASRNRSRPFKRQPSFREIFGGANRRAWRRSHQASVQQAIAAAHSGDLADNFMVRHLWLRRVLALFILLPISIISTYAFFGQLSAARIEFWLEREFWHFALGFVIWLGVFMTQLFRSWWLYLYVLGHELTHAMVVICSLGRLGRISVSTQGGYVETTKTSLLIALSPYFVPFWALIGLSLYFIFSWFYEWPLMPVYLLVFLGFTWGFHLIWTLWMIPKDQPDLRENGVLFSLLFVYLVNLAMIVLLLALASAIDPAEFAGHWWHAFSAGRDTLLALAHWCYHLLV